MANLIACGTKGQVLLALPVDEPRKPRDPGDGCGNGNADK
jgi:hypothetical protein